MIENCHYTNTNLIDISIIAEYLIEQWVKFIFLYSTCQCYLLRKFVNWGRSHCIIYSKSQKTPGVLFYGISLKLLYGIFKHTWLSCIETFCTKVIHKKKIHGVENRRCYLKSLLKKISVIWNESFFCGNLYISLGLTASTTASTGCI